MAAQTAPQRCLAIPELVYMVISLLDKNDKINCLRINSKWHDVAPQVLKRAAYSGLDDADIDELYRKRVSALLDEQDARTALIQELFLGRPNILSLLDVPSCTGLTELRCDLDTFTLEELDKLVPFVRKNPSLRKVSLHGICNRFNIQEVAQAQTCQGLCHYLDHKRQAHLSFRQHDMTSHELQALLGNDLFMLLLREAPALISLYVHPTSTLASAATVIKVNYLHLDSLSFGNIYHRELDLQTSARFLDIVTSNKRSLRRLRADC
ncbi:hypothetical protein CPB97_010603 [Podila verticillata]|nr:hypothetical protein CPB97_010603 [Podila verticillata]